MHDDQYVFDVNKLHAAHEWNKNRTEQAMIKNNPVVIVDNTNTTAKEIRPYIELAEKYGYVVSI